MENSKKVLVDVEIHASEALKQLAATKIRIDELREAQKTLDKSTKEGRMEYEACGAEIKRLSGVAQSYQKEISNTMKHQLAQQGSLEKLKTELSLNTAAYDKLSEADRNTAKGIGLHQTIAETTQKLKEEEEALGNNRRSVGDYAKAGVSLRTEIRQLTEALTQMKIAGQESSAEYKAMSARAAELNDAMGDVKEQTRGLASDSSNLDAISQGIGGLIGAYGALNAVAGALIKDNDELNNIMKNLQITMVALASVTAIYNTLQKQSIFYQKSAQFLQKIGLNQTAKAAAAEVALNTAKASGNIVTKTLATVTWLWNKALAGNPAILVAMAVLALIVAGYKLIKMFDSSAAATKVAAKSQQAYEKQVQKTQDAIDAISRRQEDSSKKAELIGRAEILELKKNGASKEAIAKREAQMAQELRDIEIKASKDKETTKRAELKSSDNNLAKQKALLATHRVGSKAYEEQLKVVNDLIRARNELVGVINKELNAQSELSLKSAEDKQADKDASAEKRKAAYMKSLDAQQKFEEAQLNAQKKYRNDSTKTDAENNALKFQHEQAFEKQMFAIQQRFDREKLEFQRKSGDITTDEYKRQDQLLQFQQTEFDNTQADKTAEFFDARKKEIIGMIGQDAEAQISDIKANYSQAMKELQAEPNMSKDKKSFYRAGLIAQQEKEIAQIKEQQASQVNAMLELKYKENLAEYSDNERKKLGIEMKITEEAITEKKAKGLSTLDDEAKLRAQKMQLSQIQLNDELLQAQGNLDKQYEIKKAAFAREQEIYKDNADKVRDIKAQEATLDAEHTQAKIDNLEMWAGKSMELMGALNELANALGQAEVQKAEEKNSKEKASLDARLKSGKISQEQYDKAIAKSDKELDKKKAEIARKQAIREKMMSITQAIISTSLAVLNGLNTKPYLPMGPIMAASAAALGAIQIATILATPLPKARKGGRIVGNSHEGGGVLIEGEGGEQLVNKYAVAAYPELINLINTIGNTGGRMPDGGYAARAMMRESAALNGGRRVIENTSVMRNQGSAARSEPALDVDYLADRLGEKIENIRVYTAIEDIRKADKMYTQMEQIAKI